MAGIREAESPVFEIKTGQSLSDGCIIDADLANRASQISDAIEPHERDLIFSKVCFSKEGGIAWQKILFYSFDTSACFPTSDIASIASRLRLMIRAFEPWF